MDTPEVINQNLDDLPDFYARWRTKAYEWLTRYGRGELADAVLLLPDMLALVLRLIRDPRTPLFFKSQLVLVAVYVLLPIDFIPEAVVGAAGLADDVVIVSVMLLRLVQSASQLDAKLLQELWPGQGNILDIINEVAHSNGKLMNSQILRSILGLVGIKMPEPAVVETDQTQTTN